MNCVKKKIIILGLLLSFGFILTGQVVDSIKVEKEGNIVKLRYQILNSNSKQTFKITVFYSDYNVKRKEIKKLLGDFGEEVIGGKPEYLVNWNVLQEIDTLISAEFFVRSELIKGKPTKLKYPFDKKYYITPTIEFPDPIYGLRASYLAKWGISLAFLKGKRNADTLYQVSQYFYDLKEAPVDVLTFSIGVTKCICNKKNFKMHILCGLAVTKLKGELGYYYGSGNSMGYTDNETSYNIETGVLTGISSLAVSLNLAIPLNSKSRPMSGIDSRINLGLGIRF